MNISEAKRMLEIANRVNDSILLTGKHGIGKSSIVKQYCKENNLHYVDLRLANNEVADLIGIPVTVEKNGKLVTTWAAPNWLNEVYEKAEAGIQSVICLEEMNRAPLEVRQCALQLSLDKQLHEHILPVVDGKETMIVSAINPADENYQVDELDEALADRFTECKIEVDVKAWLEYTRKNKVSSIVVDFILENTSKLHYTPNSGKGTSPRSWEKISQYIDIKDTISNDEMYSIMNGRLGVEVGSQFYKFYLDYSNVVKLEDIEKLISIETKVSSEIQPIADKISHLMKDMDAIQKTEMANSFKEKYSNYKDKKDLLPLLIYLYSLPLETFVGFWHAFKDSDKDYSTAVADLDTLINDKELFMRVLRAGDEKVRDYEK